jgi:phenylalanyl-tRNA synthetase beta chain
MKVPLSWLKDFVEIETNVKELSEKLTMVGLEVTSIERKEDDYILDFEITPNRSDCLSILGIARETAVALGKKLKPVKISYPPRTTAVNIKEQDFDVDIKNENNCLRYIGRILLNIEIKDSPDFIRRRLERVGLRAINNVVDITNYVLFELGQPMHAFDYNKIEGKKIIVRNAHQGERIITIDEEERVLTKDDLVIADSKKPIALAGIIGGKDTEVTEETKNILLESAYFNPSCVMRSSKRHGLITESSYRFERGVDYPTVEGASLRAVELFRKYCSKSKKKVTVLLDKELDVRKKGAEVRNRVNLKFSFVEKNLGILPPSFFMRNIFRGLGIEIVAQLKDGFKLEPPSFRHDLKEEVDYVEEIARFYGYDKIPSDKFPKIRIEREERLEQFSEKRKEDSIRDILMMLGLNEVITYTLIGEDELEFLDIENPLSVTNPLTKNFSILRPTIVPSLLKIANYNFNRSIFDLAIFEIGKIYLFKEEPEEKKVIGILLSGNKYQDYNQNSIGFKFYDLKGIIEALFLRLGIKNYKFEDKDFVYFAKGNSAQVLIDDKKGGFLGLISDKLCSKYDIKKDVFIAEIYFDKLSHHILKEIKYKKLPVFPYILRDLSILVDKERKIQDILEVISTTSSLTTDIKVIDIYKGKQVPEDKKSITFRLKFQSEKRTLKDEEADKEVSKILDDLKEKFSVSLRS